MNINKVKVNNFGIYEGTHSFDLSKINLITGRVGSGKSTIGKDSILFTLYADCDNSISALPNKKNKKDCHVILDITDRNDNILIKRSVPSKLRIKVNGQEILEDALIPDKQLWINKKFGDLQYFKRFRMIDLSQGINLLEEGKSALRKILVSFNEGMLNNIRTRLLEKKNYYDKYNKDTAVIYKHYPSEKRMEVLKDGFEQINSRANKANSKLNEIQREASQHNYKINSNSNECNNIKSKANKVKSYGKCYVCKQTLSDEKKNQIVSELRETYKTLQTDTQEAKKQLDGLKSRLDKGSAIVSSLDKRLSRVRDCINKLQVRFRQKDYKYSDRDVLLVSRTIKELDGFYGYFILESVRSLEPIVNSIVMKLGFSVKFNLNKGNFDIVLYRNDLEYTYKDLSSGERLMLSIAFQIAMLMDKGDNGFIIADEGFNNLGNEEVTALYDLFYQLPFQVISILHRFDNIPRDVYHIKLGENDVKQSKDMDSQKDGAKKSSTRKKSGTNTGRTKTVKRKTTGRSTKTRNRKTKRVKSSV